MQDACEILPQLQARQGGGEIHRSARCDLPGRVRLETVEVPVGYSCEIGYEKGFLCVMDVESLLFEISGGGLDRGERMIA